VLGSCAGRKAGRPEAGRRGIAPGGKQEGRQNSKKIEKNRKKSKKIEKNRKKSKKIEKNRKKSKKIEKHTRC
jgi:hypothetical protein